jgi:hypothetical protein
MHPAWSWERSPETLSARKDEISGLAVASHERIEAYLLYIKDRGIVSLRTLVDDGGARLNLLLSRLRAVPDMETLRFPKVHAAEISKKNLEALGFQAAGEHRLYASTARSD